MFCYTRSVSIPLELFSPGVRMKQIQRGNKVSQSYVTKILSAVGLRAQPADTYLQD